MRSRDWIRRALLLVVALGVTLGAVEVYFRVRRSLFATGYVPSANPRLVYELDPGHRVPFLDAEVSAQGLRDREFSVEKPPGVFRIAVVGDSMTFGWKVPLEDSFPKRLESMLNERGPRRYEVLNFGVPGYNTSQEAEVVREKALAFHPDLLIVFYVGNDIRLCNYIIPDPTWLGALFHRSYLLHYLLRAIDLGLATPNGVNYAYPSAWVEFKWHWLGMAYPHQRVYPQPGLEEAEYDQTRNPPVQRWWVPKRYWDMLGYGNYAAHLKTIRDLAAGAGIPFVSAGLLNKEALDANAKLHIKYVIGGFWPAQFAIDHHGDEASFVIPNDGHYSAAGTAAAAQRLFDYLVAQGLV